MPQDMANAQWIRGYRDGGDSIAMFYQQVGWARTKGKVKTDISVMRAQFTPGDSTEYDRGVIDAFLDALGC